ncbi:type 1 glutamine amidotransferase [Manganibacter manganicus]|uniref:GMP synthase n=1 Tax=Manganibacter manganicus TaxID=1873176 RepID=A0A1V8RQ19_9HYPH|nr:type 1 glutamine amidotransferase [Pseudaminobacter manganicus]OQM75301.1 GMP synthase [Pseudaminobacter manganicus]
MRVLVVQNFDDTGLGQVGTALTEAEAEVDLRKPYLGDALPADGARHDGLIILGGGQNALADETHPYFPVLLGLIRDFAARDHAVLGICLGGQLVARAFGGKNQIGGATEFGWQRIALTDAAKIDPVLATLPQQFPIFEWHDDTFSLPDKAVKLAESGGVSNQVFRIGRAVYGFQFHFEADCKLVRTWSDIFADFICSHHPDWAERLDGEMAVNGPEADAAGLAIARNWVAAIRR